MRRTFRHAAEAPGGQAAVEEGRLALFVPVRVLLDEAVRELLGHHPFQLGPGRRLARLAPHPLHGIGVVVVGEAHVELLASRFDPPRAALVPASAWRDTVAALPSSLRGRLHTELVQLGPPATWRDATWLRMQAPTQPAPFLLALREPRVGGFALWVLDAFVVPRPLVAERVTSMGALDHAPAERAPHLEMALLSLLEAPTEASERGAVALERFPYAAASLERVRAVSRGPAPRAAGAARVLAGHLASRENRVALADWLERSDVLPSDRVDLTRRLGKGADGRPLTPEVLREG